MKLRKSKKGFIISLVTALMLVMTMVPGMAFADSGASDGDLVPYDEISWYNVKNKSGKPIYINAEGDPLVRYGQYNSGLNAGQYFFHGADREMSTSAPSAESVYNNNTGYKFDYSVLSRRDGDGWTNFVTNKDGSDFSPEEDLVFAFFYGGSELNNMYKGDIKLLYDNVLKYVSLVDADKPDTPMAVFTYNESDNTINGNNGISYNAKFYDGKNGQISTGAAGTAVEFMPVYLDIGGEPQTGGTGHGRERATDVIITIDDELLEPGVDYQLIFKQADNKGSNFLDGIVYNFSTTPVPVSGITLDKEKITLQQNKTETIKATVEPENAGDKTITWSSDKPDVATVDKNGVVTAIAPGEATITASTANGKAATCKVKVISDSGAAAEPIDPSDQENGGNDDADNNDNAAETGDAMNLWALFAAMILSACGMGAVIYRRKVKE